MLLTEDRRRQIAASNPTPRPEIKTQIGLSAAEVESYSIAAAIRAKVDGSWDRGSLERECHETLASRLERTPESAGAFYVPYEIQHRGLPVPRHGTRADTVAGATSGGYLVGTENVSIIDLLRNRSVVFRLGALRLPGLVGNANVPKLTGAATAYWLGTETTQITEKEQAFGQMTFTPKTVGGYTEISRLLLKQSAPAAETIVGNDLSATLGLAVDKGGLSGDGTGGAPVGITNTAGVTTTAAASATWANLVKPQRTAGDANSDGSTFGYVTTPAVAELLANRQRFSGSNTAIWEGALADGTIAGAAAMSTAQIASGTVIAGPWSEVVVADWGVLEIGVNPFAGFQSQLVGIRALWTVDIGIRHPAAFTVLTGVT